MIVVVSVVTRGVVGCFLLASAVAAREIVEGSFDRCSLLATRPPRYTARSIAVVVWLAVTRRRCAAVALVVAGTSRKFGRACAPALSRFAPQAKSMSTYFRLGPSGSDRA